MSELSTYPLRLPRSIRASLDRVRKRDGVSINQFVSIAVAEKLAMMEAQTYFAERQARADLTAFDAMMARTEVEPPREGDRILPAQNSSLRRPVDCNTSKGVLKSNLKIRKPL